MEWTYLLQRLPAIILSPHGLKTRITKQSNFPLRSVQDKAIKQAEQGMDEGRNNKLLQALHLNVLF